MAWTALNFNPHSFMIQLGERILKGGWCDIYGIKEYPDRCAKVLAPYRRYKGSYPDPNEIVRQKYGIQDLLGYELSNYQKIITRTPQDLQQFIVRIHGVEQAEDGRYALVMDKVKDDRQQLACSLVNNTRPLQKLFWERLDRLRKDVFLRHSIDHFGIVRRNVLVQSPEHPILIDFQEGRERYPGQFWLRTPFFVRKKVNRCFARLYQELNITFPEK